VFGLYPTKGALTPGADADVTIYDPDHSCTLSADDLHGLAGYSPFEGWPIQGRVKLTMSRGKTVYADGEFQGQPGRGKFVAGKPGRM
jgi:dihydropyrimidinase